MTGGTEFNADLFGSEVLQLDDILRHSNWSSRHDLAARVKNMLVGAGHSLHAKGRDAIPLRPRWRIVMTNNDDDESLRQMPEFAENFKEKAHLFKINQFTLPKPNRTPQEWQALDAQVAKEMPAFIDSLLHWNVPERFRSDRFGVKAYHHPDLLDALYQMSKERQLAGLVEIGLMRRGNDQWGPGKAEQLKAELCQSHLVGKEAEKLLNWENATGTLLGRLAKREADKYISKRVGKSRESVWTIFLTTIDDHPTNKDY